MMVQLLGALFGLLIGVVDFAVLQRVGEGLKADQTRRILRMAGLTQIVIFPVIGWFLAPVLVGEG